MLSTQQPNKSLDPFPGAHASTNVSAIKNFLYILQRSRQDLIFND